MFPSTKSRILAGVFFVLFLGPGPFAAAQSGHLGELLRDLGSKDAASRRAAVNELADFGVEAISPLARLAGGADHTAAAGARLALQFLVHRVSAPKGAKKPGDPKERAAAARVLLAEVANRDNPLKTRRWLLRLTAFAGGAESVPALAKLLSSEEVGDMALFALERIPSKESLRALEAALPEAAPEEAVGLIGGIARHGDPASAPVLAPYTKSENEAVRLAAIAGLGRVPATSSGDLLLSIAKNGKEPDAAAARAALIDFAGRLLETGAGEAAREKNRAYALAVYKGFLGEGEKETFRCAALRGIARIEGEKALPLLLETIMNGRGDLAGVAADILDKTPGEGVTRAMAGAAIGTKDNATRIHLIHALGRRRDSAAGEAVKTILAGMAGAPEEARVSVIEALGAREDPALEGSFLDATRDKSEAVAAAAIAALGRLADPATLPRLLEIAEEGRDKENAAACDACLAVGDAAAGRDRGRALSIYTKVLGLARDDAGRVKVLERLGRLGDTAAVPVIRSFLAAESGTLRKAAARAVAPLALALADAGKERRDEAAELLRKVVAYSDSDTAVRDAAAKLRSLGHPVTIPVRAGCIRNFWVLGPFKGREAMKAENPVPPGEPADLSRAVDFKGKTFKWKYVPPDSILGKLDLLRAVAPVEDAGALAYAEVTSDKPREATFKIGSDDDVYCWLNGKLVHSFEGGRGWSPDQDSVDVRLEKGTNRILLKVLNGGGDWAVSLRIETREGEPIHLEERRP